jgi:DNA (cytosine-5)-methyltransferase 1
MNKQPLMFDVCCGAGGASMGYSRAGFCVIGVDINPMPRYPFQFIQADALEFLDGLFHCPSTVFGPVAAIHISPPCQGYSCTKSINPHANDYPKLISPARELLQSIGLPYVIENVEGARRDMISPVILCGSQFGLRREFNGERAYLRRHRCFETNWALTDAGPHDHSGYAFPVFGGGPGGARNLHLRGKGAAAMARELMDIDWMTRDELDESVPPVFTEYVGTHLMRELTGTYERAA